MISRLRPDTVGWDDPAPNHRDQRAAAAVWSQGAGGEWLTAATPTRARLTRDGKLTAVVSWSATWGG